MWFTHFWLLSVVQTQDHLGSGRAIDGGRYSLLITMWHSHDDVCIHICTEKGHFRLLLRALCLGRGISLQPLFRTTLSGFFMHAFLCSIDQRVQEVMRI